MGIVVEKCKAMVKAYLGAIRDEPGRKAAAELMRKYYELGYEVEDCPPPAGYKDYNEWLVAAKLNLNRMNKRADEPVRA